MLKLRKVISLMLAAVMLMSMIPPVQVRAEDEHTLSNTAEPGSVVDSGTCGENLTWTLDDEGTLTISGTGAMDNYDLENVAPWKTYNEQIKFAVLEEGVSNLGSQAFHSCSSLTSIMLPDSVTGIGDGAFFNCSNLTDVTLPDSVTTIGASAFGACSSLQEIAIPAGVTTIGKSAFQYCSSLTSIVIPEGVTSIGQDTFYYCSSLASVTLPEGLTTIGEYAFNYCSSLTGITIPDSVTEICSGAFYGCSKLEKIILPGNVTSIGSWSFGGCSGLKELAIPAGVTLIDFKAFSGCSNLENLYYGGTVEEWAALGDYRPSAVYIHYSCANPETHWTLAGKKPTCTEDGNSYEVCSCGYERNAQTVSAPGHNYVDGVCSVCGGLDDQVYVAGGTCGEDVYWKLDTAGTLTIYGNGTMEEYSYESPAPWDAHREAIREVVILEGVTTISPVAFSNCSSLTDVVIPEGVTDIGYCAFEYCTALKSITIPDSVTTIGVEAFSGCFSLEYIGIPEGVTYIANKLFMDCSSLRSVTIPRSVTGIGGNAFSGCTSLTDLVLPEGVTDIGSGGTFMGCTSLTSITIPSGVTHIPMDAFNYCTGMTSITIPGSVTIIDCNAFSGCTSLTAVYFGGTAEEWAALGDYRPDVSYVHYSCVDAEGHWKTVQVDATCVEDGYTRDECDCGYVRNEERVPATGHTEVTDEAVAPTCSEPGLTEGKHCSACGEVLVKQEVVPAASHKPGEAATCDTAKKCAVCGEELEAALGHNMGQWVVVTEPSPAADGEDRRTCTRCDHYESRTIEYQGNLLKQEGEDFANQDTVWIDGVAYPIVVRGGERYVDLPTEEDCILVTYTYHVGDASDIHTQYPTGMKVYQVTDGAITYIPELDNLLQYSGSSIRIVGVKGIRMITSLSRNVKSALTGKGLAGFTLVEYGTALAWASEIDPAVGLVLGASYTKSNYAYRKGVADPVFKTTATQVQYTNVLVDFKDDQCIPDIAMRPYIILENAQGERVTIYGGTIYRSIGYIAYQNRNAFKPGTAAYEYVWSIIHHVYGKKYDAEYKK